MYFLNVPYHQKDEAKALGAKWNPNAKKWYFLNFDDAGKFEKWLTNELRNKLEIHKIIQEREIPYLTHFTSLQNFERIMQIGLRSREEMNNLGNYQYFDLDRAEGILNGICLSISFPNYKMFYSYRCRYPDVDWVVLAISPKILYEKDCLFFPTNAAFGKYRSCTQESFSSYQAFSAMFSECVENTSGNIVRSNNLLENFTTDVQAEVICLNSIEAQYIKFCVVENIDNLNYLKTNYQWLDCCLSQGDFKFFDNREWVLPYSW